MKLKWYGHAAFRVTTEKGTAIIIDPYEPGGFEGAISYGQITDPADIVITSHDHADHNYTKGIQGAFKQIKEAGEFEEKDVRIRTIPVFHDESKGKERGPNLISVISADGLTLAHLGDLGHEIEADVLKKIGKVNVLLIPVGGFFTIDSQMASKVRFALDPAITVPMHFKTPKCAFPLTTADAFTGGKANVRTLKGSELEISKASLPESPEIVVLQYAM